MPDPREKKMQRAYEIAEELIADKLQEADPEMAREVAESQDVDVVVVRGQYDFIERVLSLSRTPYRLVHPQEVSRMGLRPDQILFVNCPGNLDAEGLSTLQDFTLQGGFLFTTDWALKNILEPVFPGYVRYNQKATADEVVRVEVDSGEDPFLKTILGPQDDPQWWLEGSSYPIEIPNPGQVEVLVRSKEIGEKYGADPVFVSFTPGEGKIYHMISHFYLQRSETRTQRHRSCSMEYFNEKELDPGLRSKYEAMGMQEESLADVESAYSSSAMYKKILRDKMRQLKERALSKLRHPTRYQALLALADETEVY